MAVYVINQCSLLGFVANLSVLRLPVMTTKTMPKQFGAVFRSNYGYSTFALGLAPQYSASAFESDAG
jgi:hypothetical protein